MAFLLIQKRAIFIKLNLFNKLYYFGLTNANKRSKNQKIKYWPKAKLVKDI